MVHILLTGFEPFGGEAVNASGEAVERVADTWRSEHRLSTAILPVVFGRAGDEVVSLVAELEPDVVIAVGEAGGRTAITPERTAVNLVVARIPDNAGAAPDGVEIVAGGAESLQAALDVDGLVMAGLAAGVPSEVSETAGRFVCNELFYRVVSGIAEDVSRGFIHVPAVRGASGELSIDDLARGLAAMAEAAADAHSVRGAAAASGSADGEREARTLDELASRSWPATEIVELGGWRLRFAGGVTKRANSVLPLGDPIDDVGASLGRSADVDAAIARVEQECGDRGVRTAFQVGPASRPAGLREILEARGYVSEAPTLVLTAVLADVFTGRERVSSDRVEIADEPSEEWIDLWWSIDGRGGSAERDIARGILTGVPSLYGTIADGSGTVAVARLTVVDGRAGLSAVAVHPDARRRGLATTLALALFAEAEREHGATDAWIQVVEENAAARAAYAGLGFRPVSGYTYFLAPDHLASDRRVPDDLAPGAGSASSARPA